MPKFVTNNVMNTEHFTLRKALPGDLDEIWKILQFAIESRRKDGSQQWQNGYPNEQTAKDDIETGHGYVFTENGKIATYSALIKNNEPAYDTIEGAWLSDGDFLVVHRVAVSEDFSGRGIIQKLFLAFEDFARENDIPSIKVDTNFDNGAMLHILQKLNYTYCGKVWLAGGERVAYEKLIQ